MNELTAFLGGWIASQRWYANKGGTPALVEVGEWSMATAEDGVTIVSHLLLDHGVGRPALYQVPLTYRRSSADGPEFGFVGELEDGSHRFVYDGPHDPAYTAALLATIMGEQRATGDRVVVFGRCDRQVPTSTLRSRVLTGEQSNTSIIFESEDGSEPPLICKVFRALHHGDNPDVELQSALARAGSTSVPRSVGSIVGEWTDAGEPTGFAVGHLAFAQEFLPGVEDAWRVALRAAAAGEDFTGAAHALGAATAGVHATLALTLPSSPTTPNDIAAILTQMRVRLAAAIAAAPEIEDHRAAIEAVFEAARSAPWPALQRTHGDYHLGQVLSAPGRGWVLVDFEGEPLRPMHERTRLDIPLRDVAGMLRSFDYVAGCLALEQSIDAYRWATAARAAFIDGYVEASGYDVRANGALLDAFEIDKALYETVYEAGNRPAWLLIPVTAITRLAETASPSGRNV